MVFFKHAIAVLIVASAAAESLANDLAAPVYVRRRPAATRHYHYPAYAGGYFGGGGRGAWGCYPYYPNYPSTMAGTYRGYYYTRPYPTHLDYQAVRSRAPMVVPVPEAFYAEPVIKDVPPPPEVVPDGLP